MNDLERYLDFLSYILDIENTVDEYEEKEEEEVETETVWNYIITQDAITLNCGDKCETITKDNDNFQNIRKLIVDGNYQEAFSRMNVKEGIEKWCKGYLSIEGDKVTYNEVPITNKLTDRIINLMTTGDMEFERFAKFLNKVLENPSFKNRERLMDFAAAGDIDISDNGDLICFKNVGNDYHDKRTGKFRYAVGDKPSMPRHMVDDRDENSCSAGLHACSLRYLKECWGTSGKTLLVTVDPRNVVSIPFDYSDSKLRCCEMEVIEDITENLNQYFSLLD